MLVLGLLAAGCSVVRETGRSRLALLPAAIVNSLGASSYQEVTGKYRVIRGTPEARMVEAVGRRIAAVAPGDYEWEFKLLDAPDVVNAFALPGGKVAFFSGILPICRNEDGVAAVMGHEIAHVTAEHGNERMTQSLLGSLGMSLVRAAAKNWDGADERTKSQILAALGVGLKFGVMLPFSRKHEAEADEIGLRYLVRAGFDPREAPLLWERMAKLSPNRPPEFLSTHPDPLWRAQRLRELIPRILAEERGAR